MTDQLSHYPPLSIDDFDAFYMAIHKSGTDEFPPFQWQRRLAQQVCEGSWPEYIKLPTSSGKTSVIDIAIFALAFQACESNRPNGVMTAARRIFFVVDRRIIVNEAFVQTHKTATKLWHAAKANDDQPKILHQVAYWLQILNGDDKQAPPLDCRELRGGIYRDDAWVRSPLQPTVLTSTVDQVGSRLLFRGYGVSNRNRPIHAALTAHDSLIILDEAHCSKPFSQTLTAVKRYRGDTWADEPIESPFNFVQMTATLPGDVGNAAFTLDEQLDYAKDRLLQQRHGCAKPVQLVQAVGAKGKSLAVKLAKELVEKAKELAANHGCVRIAVIVNRVAIARAAYELLKDKHDTSLMIGRMRPLDRDKLTGELQTKFRSGSNAEFATPQFVVATQCMEVGADFDFDGMVCQCASLDALRQRFGRLNRLGNKPHARGFIVAAEGDALPISKLNDEKPADSIYGNALAETWHWLNSVSTDGTVNFGIKPMDRLVADQNCEKLSAPPPDAPVLMPAHVDMLCQTSQEFRPEPNIAWYLHGRHRGMPEIRVCWRADLDMANFDPAKRPNVGYWRDAVAACPPSSAECLSVPLPFFKKWLAGENLVDDTGDVLGEQAEQEDIGSSKAKKLVPGRCALVWRGSRPKRTGSHSSGDATDRHPGFLIREDQANGLRPNDTVVVPAEFGGWSQFGHFPAAPPEPVSPNEWRLNDESAEGKTNVGQTDISDGNCNPLATIDVADAAYCQSRARTILRVHPKLIVTDSAKSAFELLLKNEFLNNGEADLSLSAMKKHLSQHDSNSDEQDSPWTKSRLGRLLCNGSKLSRYRNGIVWVTPLHPELAIQGSIPPLPLDSFGDDSSLNETGRLSLAQHLADVADEVTRLTTNLRVSETLKETLETAARCHDLGKADPRFQAMLLNKPLNIAFMQSKLWAKSGVPGFNAANTLPANFRHEMLSLNLLDRIDIGKTDEDVLRHIVAAHHGYGRPFAPVCVDEAPEGFCLDEFELGAVTEDDRSSWLPAHRLNSKIADRFWKLNRRFGWWGLAQLETILRLADWTASAAPGSGDVKSLKFRPAKHEAKSAKTSQPLILGGIDGSSPLGFLAALGVFRTLSRSDVGEMWSFGWQQHAGAWRPALFNDSESATTENELVGMLMELLTVEADSHPALADPAPTVDRRTAFDNVANAATPQDRDAADWLSCNGSDMTGPEVISQLQTTRRDYHSINIRGLVEGTQASHVHRTLFQPWDYADPIAGVSLHLEPREDRRHAYQWHTPSGDPTRQLFGGMMGANRLALEAWPFFQSLPYLDKLATVGFQGTRVSNTRFNWPIWESPISIAVVSSLLSLAELQTDKLSIDSLSGMGIVRVYQSRKILVGKTPNLTTASPVMA